MDAKAKIMDLLSQAKMMADKAGIDLQPMFDECCGDQEEESMGEDSSENGEEKQPMDKSKIALIVAKLKGQKSEE